MKYVIFAGGHGTRLWPLSRKNSPKQFEKVFDGKSTLQLAIDRIRPIADFEDIFVSTNQNYKEIILEQIPELRLENIILEPAKRDLAAAVGLAFFYLNSLGFNEPVAILWADHLMEREDEFRKALLSGEQLIKDNPKRFVYLGEKPRYANHNLGWITVGGEINKINELSVVEFLSWKYRPDLELCKKLFEEGNSLWNPGYWITSIDFVLDLYHRFKPEMSDVLEKITTDMSKITDLYPKLESISFDDAIIENTNSNDAVVIKVDLGWSDPGTLYALKEALAESEVENITQGLVEEIDTKDTLVINKEAEKLVSVIGLDGHVVINTKDTILVVHKDKVPKVKEMVKKLEEEGLDKYI